VLPYTEWTESTKLTVDMATPPKKDYEMLRVIMNPKSGEKGIIFPIEKSDAAGMAVKIDAILDYVIKLEIERQLTTTVVKKESRNDSNQYASKSSKSNGGYTQQVPEDDNPFGESNKKQNSSIVDEDDDIPW
jgi:hypothetical protein